MYMLDTNICMYIIKKRTESVLRQLKTKKENGLFIYTITLSELESGIENSAHKEKNRIALMEFLSILGIKQFDEYAAKKYGIIKRNLNLSQNCLIEPMDMLIIAHAKSQNMILVTSNTKEFTGINDLKVENWI